MVIAAVSPQKLITVFNPFPLIQKRQFLANITHNQYYLLNSLVWKAPIFSQFVPEIQIYFLI